MKQILLDTNIVIYFLNNNLSTVRLLEKFHDVLFSISIVTWIEALAGSVYQNLSIDEMKERISHFIRIPLDENISKITAHLIQENVLAGRRKVFQDTAIAATALVYDMPFITNNPRDFRNIKGLKIISPNT